MAEKEKEAKDKRHWSEKKEELLKKKEQAK